MEVDKEIESRILMEYDQQGKFVSTDPVEVAQVVRLVGIGTDDFWPKPKSSLISSTMMHC